MFQQKVVFECADLAEVDESVPGRDLVRPPLTPAAADVHGELWNKFLHIIQLNIDGPRFNSGVSEIIQFIHAKGFSLETIHKLHLP